MRDDAQHAPAAPVRLPFGPALTPPDGARASSPPATAGERLTSAARATARRLESLPGDWAADQLGAVVYAAALVDLRGSLPPDAFAECQQYYRDHRASLLAQFRPRAD